MRYLFIGLFIVSLIAGATAWQLNKPQGETGLLGQALTTVGVKQRVNQQRAYMDAMMKDLIIKQQQLIEDFDDNKAFLEKSNERIKTITELASQAMEKNDNDLLTIKATMQALQDKNRLLIERGQELVRFNQEQIKQRQKNLMEAGLASIDSAVNEHRLGEIGKQLFSQRDNYLNDVVMQSQNINERMITIRDKFKASIRQMEVSHSPEFVEKIKSLADRSDDMLVFVKERQQRLRDMVQENKEKLQQARDRLRDMSNLREQQITDTNRIAQNRSTDMAQRNKQQLEQLKSQRLNTQP